MPRIEIDVAFCDLGLIVLDENGATYRSQVYGNACGQVSAQGYFVPLDRTLPEICPESIEVALGRLLENAPYLSEQMANDVDDLLAKYGETSFLRVDRSLLRESGEAWVYVEISSGRENPIQGTGPWMGVLTWANSD